MKLSIENPCHEDWNAMKPNEQGAHCFSCQKTVIDFSKKSIHEIKSFFENISSSEKICGRFKSEQLKELSFNEFYNRFKNWHLTHKIAVVLVFTFGLTLFSCQSGTPEKEMIAGEVSEIIHDTITPKDTIQKKDSIINKVSNDIKKIKPSEEHYKMGEMVASPITTCTVNNNEGKMLKGDVSFESDTLINNENKKQFIKGKVIRNPK